MRQLFKYFALSLFLLSTHSSNAALLIEPVIGYSSGKYNATIKELASGTEIDDFSESIKGSSYGGRIGYQNLGFQFGVDYLASKMDLDGDDFTTSELGVFAGFEFPILFRVYGGYILSGTGKTEDEDGNSLDFKGGSGPKIGLGFTLLPFLDVNLEYRSVKYDTYEFSDGGFDFGVDSDYSAVMLGLSFPITLF